MKQEVTFQYETEANASFLVGALAAESAVVQYQFKMLENNSIAHLLEIRKYQANNTVRLCYNVTAKLSLQQATVRKRMQKQEFLHILRALVEAALELQEYQLPLAGLLLDEKYIFVRSGSFEPAFVYLPIYTEDNGIGNIRDFVQQMILNSRISSTNDNFIQQLLDLFNEENITLQRLDDGLKALDKTASKPKPQYPTEAVPVPAPPVFTPAQVAVQPKDDEPIVPAKPARPAEHGARMVKPKAAEGGSRKLVFVAVQAALVVLVVVVVLPGFLQNEDGSFNLSYLAGVLILCTGVDVVLYRELFVNNKQSAAPKKNVKKSASPAKKRQKPGKKAVKPNKQAAANVQPEVLPDALPESAPAAPAAIPTYVSPAPAYVPSAPVPQAVPEEVWETVVVDDDNAVGEGYLEYYDNGLAVRIHLGEGLTRVGSYAPSVDYVLPGKRVSKVHAEFVRRDEQYFVRDINSTNGTYINGSQERIVSNQEIELQNGDQLRLANIEMVFRC